MPPCIKTHSSSSILQLYNDIWLKEDMGPLLYITATPSTLIAKVSRKGGKCPFCFTEYQTICRILAATGTQLASVHKYRTFKRLCVGFFLCVSLLDKIKREKNETKENKDAKAEINRLLIRPRQDCTRSKCKSMLPKWGLFTPTSLLNYARQKNVHVSHTQWMHGKWRRGRVTPRHQITARQKNNDYS